MNSAVADVPSMIMGLDAGDNAEVIGALGDLIQNPSCDERLTNCILAEELLFAAGVNAKNIEDMMRLCEK